MQKTTDVLIIGAGPVGLFAAFYAGLRGLKSHLVDAMASPGGRLTALYPDKPIYDVPGFPSILAKDLVSALVEQADRYKPQYSLQHTVSNLQWSDEEHVWHATTQNGVISGRTVLVTSGIGLYGPKKHMALNADLYTKTGHVVYSVEQKHHYAGKTVVVIGGGDSALDWALELSAIGAHVHLVHRSAHFRAHEDSVLKLQKNLKITKHLGYEVSRFLGSAETLQEVELSASTQTEGAEPEWVRIQADATLVCFGYVTARGGLQSGQPLEFSVIGGQKRILVDACMTTHLSGIFAAGDVVWNEAKLDLIATGFGEAAIAVTAARKFLFPHEKIRVVHSTSLLGEKN